LYHEVSVQGIRHTVHCQDRAFCKPYTAKVREFCRLHSSVRAFCELCSHISGHSADYTARTGHSEFCTLPGQGILNSVHCRDRAFCKLYTAEVRAFCRLYTAKVRAFFKLYTAKVRAFCRLYTDRPGHSADCTQPRSWHSANYTAKDRAFCRLHNQVKAFCKLFIPQSSGYSANCTPPRSEHSANCTPPRSGHFADCTLPGQGILQTVHCQVRAFCTSCRQTIHNHWVSPV